MKPTMYHPGAADRLQRDHDLSGWSAEVVARIANDPDSVVFVSASSEFIVQEIHDNYLVCKHWDGTAGWGSNVNVARDPELRVSHYDGETIDGLDYAYTGPQARTVTNASEESKDQVVIPKCHVPGDGKASIIVALLRRTDVLNDAGSATISCQWVEHTQRAYANVEGAS